MSTEKCFTQSSVGQLCSAIVDRLTRGESICEDEVFDDVSCINDVVEQLFNLLDVDSDMLTLNELRALVGHIDHHRSVREENHAADHNHDHDDGHNDDHGDDNDGKDDENDYDGDHHNDHNANNDHDHDEDNNVSCF